MPFGRKLNRAFNGGFGRKVVRDAQGFGRKVYTLERKAVNTIDRVAPVASLVATLAGRPDIGKAITKGNQSLQDAQLSGVEFYHKYGKGALGNRNINNPLAGTSPDFETSGLAGLA